MTEVEKLLNRYGESVVSEMKTRLKNAGKVASGDLYDSLKYELIKTVNSIELSFLMLDYGQYVDKGRRPGKMPPVSAIEKWTKLKGIPKSAAWPIAVNIGKYGIRPTNFFTISTTRRQKQIDAQLEVALAQDIENQLDKSFKK